MRCKTRLEALDDSYLKTCRVMDWEGVYRIRDMLDAHGMGLLMPFAPPSFVTPEVCSRAMFGRCFRRIISAKKVAAFSRSHDFGSNSHAQTRCCAVARLVAASVWEAAACDCKMNMVAGRKK